jgi:hypothetical protein
MSSFLTRLGADVWMLLELSNASAVLVAMISFSLLEKTVQAPIL